jgi:exosortase
MVFDMSAKALQLGKIPPKLTVTALLALSLFWLFWPTLAELARRWLEQSQYSHGFLVPLFSVYLLWARRERLRSNDNPTAWTGFFILMIGLAVHFAGTFVYIDWLKGIALLPCLVGLALLAGGRQAVGWAWPAILFLFFMIPLPFRLETSLSYPLQRFATIASTFVLQTFGFAAFAQGNIIHLGEFPIGVVEACNGLSMMLVFFRSRWFRISRASWSPPCCTR